MRRQAKIRKRRPRGDGSRGPRSGSTCGRPACGSAVVATGTRRTVQDIPSRTTARGSATTLIGVLRIAFLLLACLATVSAGVGSTPTLSDLGGQPRAEPTLTPGLVGFLPTYGGEPSEVICHMVGGTSLCSLDVLTRNLEEDNRDAFGNEMKRKKVRDTGDIEAPGAVRALPKPGASSRAASIPPGQTLPSSAPPGANDEAGADSSAQEVPLQGCLIRRTTKGNDAEKELLRRQTEPPYHHTGGHAKCAPHQCPRWVNGTPCPPIHPPQSTHTCVRRLRRRRVSLLRVVDTALPLSGGSRDERLACKIDPCLPRI